LDAKGGGESETPANLSWLGAIYSSVYGQQLLTVFLFVRDCLAAAFRQERAF